MVDWLDWDRHWFDVGRHGRNRPWLEGRLEDDPAFKKANIGCGTLVFSPKNGWDNFDQFPDAEHEVYQLKLTEPMDFIEDDTYDYLFFSNVLEHIPDTVPGVDGEIWYYMLEELLRITKPGGHWEIHGPDPRDAIYTLQVGGHTRLVGKHTFEHLTIRYTQGAMKTTELHDRYGMTLVDYGSYSRFKMGKITDWHFRKYLGRRLGDIAVKILGKPGQIRMVLRVEKGVRS